MLIAALGGGYVFALRRLGPRHVAPGARSATRVQMAAFGGGLLTVWLGADWPLHDLGEGYLYSVHMTQHLLFTLVAPPLLLLGTPAWLARELLRPAWLFAVVSRLARPVPALILFNALIVVTHWPAFVDLTLRSEPTHFAAHAAIFGSALLMWCPVVAPLPEWRPLSPPAQMLYLFLQSIVPTVPASFLVFAEHPIYHFYETVPRLWGLSAGEDQRIGGLLMKLGGGLLLWSIITVIFFRWHADEESADRSARRWRALEREIDDPMRWTAS
ncbi:MAG TPA: cytochrome c oxidase assembly protein [Acidimicrobiia bacterium]